MFATGADHEDDGESFVPNYFRFNRLDDLHFRKQIDLDKILSTC